MIHLLGIYLFTGSLGVSLGINVVSKKKSRYKLLSEKQKKAITFDGRITAQDINNNEQVEKVIPTQFVSNNEQKVNHYLAISGIGLSLSIIGQLIYYPIALFSIPIIGYLSAVVIQDAYQGLKQKKLRLTLLDSVAICVGIGTGFYIFSTTVTTIYFYALKMRYKARYKRQNILFSDTVNSHLQETVWLIRDGVEINTSLEQISKNDKIVINAGEIIPVDGIIEEGYAYIDQYMLTGEVLPEVKNTGQLVFTNMVVISGRIIIRVEKVGIQTIATNIVAISDTTDNAISHFQTQNEKVANDSVMPTMGIAGLALLASGPMSMAVVLSSNFAEIMRLSSPLGMLNYLDIAVQSGLFIKDGDTLEQLAKVDTVIFDKTGALIQEQPYIGEIYCTKRLTKKDILFYTAAAEYGQQHPIAKAIQDEAKKQGIRVPHIDNTVYHAGYGIEATVNKKSISIGSASFMKKLAISLPNSLQEIENNAFNQGYSLIYTAIDGLLCGIIELHPLLRLEAKETIQYLQQKNIEVYILSSEKDELVQILANELQVDKYIAAIRSEYKAKIIEQLQQKGKTVCFVGNSIDAMALKKAAVSVSLSASSNVAMDDIQIILTNNNLLQLLNAINLAKSFTQNQKQGMNIAAIAPSLICMGGAVFFNFTLMSTMVFYTLGATIGVGNAMLPVIKNEAMKTLKDETIKAQNNPSS